MNEFAVFKPANENAIAKHTTLAAAVRLIAAEMETHLSELYKIRHRLDADDLASAITESLHAAANKIAEA